MPFRELSSRQSGKKVIDLQRLFFVSQLFEVSVKQIVALISGKKDGFTYFKENEGMKKLFSSVDQNQYSSVIGVLFILRRHTHSLRHIFFWPHLKVMKAAQNIDRKSVG